MSLLAKICQPLLSVAGVTLLSGKDFNQMVPDADQPCISTLGPLLLTDPFQFCYVGVPFAELAELNHSKMQHLFCFNHYLLANWCF